MINPLKSKNSVVRRLSLLVLCLTYLPICFIVGVVVETWREFTRAYNNMRLSHTLTDMKDTLFKIIAKVWEGTL